MSNMADILDAIEKQGEAFEAYKRTNDRRIEALKSGNTSEADELEQKLNRINADLASFNETKKRLELEREADRERLEELEAKSNRPGKTAGEKTADEYNEAFTSWIRAKGQSPAHEAKMHDIVRKARDMEAKGMESKAISTLTATPSAGGYAVPEVISREIERLELLFSPIRRLVKVVRTNTSDYKELVNIRGASAGWVGESGSRTQTNASLLREVTPTHGELYAYPQASDWALDDIFFNVENWLAMEVADQFALLEGAAVISGDGTNKPTGMLNTTPVLTDDDASPIRAAAAYEYLPCNGDTSPAVAELEADCLIDLVYLLNSAYRPGAYWVMNSATTGAVRKLKASDGHYLWQPGLAMGQPDRLLGYPVETWEQMQDIGTNNFPIAFGNFMRGYVLVDRVGMMITRDNVTNVGFTKFYIRRREGGHVLNNNAIKFLRTTV